jgi:hypothetical protein
MPNPIKMTYTGFDRLKQEEPMIVAKKAHNPAKTG